MNPERPLNLRHLSRLDSTSLSGWQLRLPEWHPEGPATTYFADSRYGSPNAALRAARKARDDSFKAAGLPVNPAGRRPMGNVGLSNTSGLTGVCLALHRARRAACWVALWSENGVAKRKAFYVGQYGFEVAFWLAVELRQKMTGILFTNEALRSALHNPVTRARMLDCIAPRRTAQN